MNALIVYAHPESKSFNGQLKEFAATLLAQSGVRVMISDLYQQKFNPVASASDFTYPVSPERLGYVHEQRHAAAHGHYRSDILEEQKKLAEADLVIFQFPLWWYAVPAILKGWADRILSYGFAYDANRMFNTGLLKGKYALMSITTGGSRAELDADIAHTGSVESFLKPFSGGVLEFVGIDVLPPSIIYAISSLTPEDREAAFATYGARLLDAVQRVQSLHRPH